MRNLQSVYSLNPRPWKDLGWLEHSYWQWRRSSVQRDGKTPQESCRIWALNAALYSDPQSPARKWCCSPATLLWEQKERTVALIPASTLPSTTTRENRPWRKRPCWLWPVSPKRDTYYTPGVPRTSPAPHWVPAIWKGGGEETHWRWGGMWGFNLCIISCSNKHSLEILKGEHFFKSLLHNYYYIIICYGHLFYQDFSLHLCFVFYFPEYIMYSFCV